MIVFSLMKHKGLCCFIIREIGVLSDASLYYCPFPLYYCVMFFWVGAGLNRVAIPVKNKT